MQPFRKSAREEREVKVRAVRVPGRAVLRHSLAIGRSDHWVLATVMHLQKRERKKKKSVKYTEPSK